MIKTLLMLLGFIISLFIFPPLGPIVYIIGLIILIITFRLLHTSLSTLDNIGKCSGIPFWLQVILGSIIMFLFVLYFHISGFDETASVLNAIVMTCITLGSFNFIYKQYKKIIYKKYLIKVVAQHFTTLLAKEEELVYVGDYGETVYNKWYEEIDRFADNVIDQRTKSTFSDNELRWCIIEIFNKIKNN